MIEMGQPSHAFDLAKMPGGPRHRALEPARRAAGHPGRAGAHRSPRRSASSAGRGARSAWPASWAAPPARSRTRRARSRWRPPTGTRRPSAARPRPSGCTPRPRTASSAGRTPKRRRPRSRASRTSLAKIGAGTTRPGLIDRYVAPASAHARRRCVRAASRPSWARRWRCRSRGASSAGLGFTVGEPSEAWTVDVPDLARRRHARDRPRRGGRAAITAWAASPPPSRRARGSEGLRPAQRRDRGLREVLAGAGLTEVVTYSFVSEAGAFGPAPRRLRLANPLSAEQAVLRDVARLPGPPSALAHERAAGPARRAALRARARASGSIASSRDAGPRGAAARRAARRPRARPLVRGPRAPRTSSTRRGSSSSWPHRFGVAVPAFVELSGPARPGLLHPGQSAALAPLRPGRPSEYVGAAPSRPRRAPGS